MNKNEKLRAMQRPVSVRVWCGAEQVQHPYNATQTPIVVSAAYGYNDIDAWYDVAQGKLPGYIYSMSNPTVATLEALCELNSPSRRWHSAAAWLPSVPCCIPSFKRQACGIDPRQLRRYQQDLRRVPAAHGRAGLPVRHPRHRSAGARDRRGCDLLYLKPLPTPPLRYWTSSAWRCRPEGWRVVVADTPSPPAEPEPAGPGRGCSGAQCHQVPVRAR